MTKPVRTFRPDLEKLEDRVVPAVSIGLSGKTLVINGDSAHNNVTVQHRSGKLTVTSISTGSSTQRLTRTFFTRNVNFVRFSGNAGNDRLALNMNTFTCNSSATGGSGNDTLLGSDRGDDEFWGGLGNDYLRGYGADDSLYGGDGRDTLVGDGGDDGLYGGDGVDSLTGGDGSNRFLQKVFDREVKDFERHDASLVFTNGNRSWSQAEIEHVDAGLRVLHLRTGNDNLLERKNGSSIVFHRRIKDTADPSTYAVNHENGRITLYDRAFKTTALTTQTVIHEMGHNWDDPGEMGSTSRFNTWKSLSGWRNTNPNSTRYAKSLDGDWWYLKTAKFGTKDGYGKTNPYEDFSIAWESYFSYKYNLSKVNINPLPSAKTTFLNNMFNLLD